MATFTVTTAADVVNAGDGVLSLREAVQQANATTAADTIVFANALEGQTLTLTQGELNLAGQPDTFDRILTIDGDSDNNGSRVTLSGGGVSRVLAVGDGADVSLADLTIANGQTAEGDGAGIFIGEQCNVEITGCTIRNNTAGSGNFEVGYSYGSGGGIHLSESSFLQIQESQINNNRANDGGGGLSVAGFMQMYSTNVDSNISSAYRDSRSGGGILVLGSARVTGSTITNNSAGAGGGIAGAFVRIENSTIAGNVAGDYYAGSGGGIAVSDLVVQSSTITGNRVEAGDGEAGAAGIVSGNARISDSIVAGNYYYEAAKDIGPGARYQGTQEGIVPLAYSNGHNVFGSIVAGAAPGDMQLVPVEKIFASVDPETMGGRLALNGGPVPTAALRDALDNPALGGAAAVAAPTTDARGVARPLPATTNPDVGAFELAQLRISSQPSAGNDVISGTTGTDTISALGGVDIVNGLAGNDRLYGNDGGDTLRGDAGDDLLEGGTGSDLLNGGSGLDQVSYLNDTIPLGLRIELYDEGDFVARAYRGNEIDTLVDIENVDGSNYSDAITGDESRNRLGGAGGDDIIHGGGEADSLLGGLDNDRLYGGWGNDLLEGGFGNDWLDGGDGVDQISYFNDTSSLAVTIDLFTNTVTRSGEADRLKDIENADGTNSADTITGGSGVNRLGGAGGNDTIRGLGGDDLLIGGPGNDVLDGDAGLDLADYTAGGAVVVDLALATDTATRGSEVDTLREIEGAIGSAGADSFKGDALANLFRGQGGKDTLTGGAGADVFDFDALAHSTVGANRDRVTDFTPGSDDLDLATIDARAATPAVNDAFTFLAARGAAFTGAGQVRWYQSGGVTLVEANVDANLAPDLQIELAGLKTLSAADFVL